MAEELTRRYVSGYRNIAITDDYGNYMYLGDIVEVRVMPFDFITIGVLCFSEEKCAFYVEHDYGQMSLSHSSEDYNMGATIPVTLTFRKKNSCEIKEDVK